MSPQPACGGVGLPWVPAEWAQSPGKPGAAFGHLERELFTRQVTWDPVGPSLDLTVLSWPRSQHRCSRGDGCEQWCACCSGPQTLYHGRGRPPLALFWVWAPMCSSYDNDAVTFRLCRWGKQGSEGCLPRGTQPGLGSLSSREPLCDSGRERLPPAAIQNSPW